MTDIVLCNWMVVIYSADCSVSSPSKSLRSSRISKSLSLITFPCDAFISLRGTKIYNHVTLEERNQFVLVLPYILQISEHVGVEENSLLLKASGFEQLH